MNVSKKKNLLSIIYKDLFNSKIHIFLMLCILLSSFFIIFITYKIKIINDNLLRLHLENNFLQNYYYNLILEKNLLTGYSYFENKMKKKNMLYINSAQKNKLFFIYKQPI